MKNKSFLKLLDLTPAEISNLLALAADFKAKKKAGIPHRLCEGKNIVLLFEKDDETHGAQWRHSGNALLTAEPAGAAGGFDSAPAVPAACFTDLRSGR